MNVCQSRGEENGENSICTVSVLNILIDFCSHTKFAPPLEDIEIRRWSNRQYSIVAFISRRSISIHHNSLLRGIRERRPAACFRRYPHDRETAKCCAELVRIRFGRHNNEPGTFR